MWKEHEAEFRRTFPRWADRLTNRFIRDLPCLALFTRNGHLSAFHRKIHRITIRTERSGRNKSAGWPSTVHRCQHRHAKWMNDGIDPPGGSVAPSLHRKTTKLFMSRTLERQLFIIFRPFPPALPSFLIRLGKHSANSSQHIHCPFHIFVKNVEGFKFLFIDRELWRGRNERINSCGP